MESDEDSSFGFLQKSSDFDLANRDRDFDEGSNSNSNSNPEIVFSTTSASSVVSSAQHSLAATHYE